MTTLTYDADESPDPDRWLAADEDERFRAVRAYHDQLDHHPEAESMEAHVGIHAAVETQIAMGDPPEAAEKLEELLEAGVDRHAAIHALAVPTAHVMYGVVDEDEFGDTSDILAEKIDQVTVEDGRKQENTWDRARGDSEQTARRRKRPDPAKKRQRRRNRDDS